MADMLKYNYDRHGNNTIPNSSFKVREFTCPSDLDKLKMLTIDPVLVHLLQSLSEALDAKVKIKHGYVCTSKCGCCDVEYGGQRILHDTGQCADIYCVDNKTNKNVDSLLVAAVAEQLGFTGIVRKDKYTVHLDTDKRMIGGTMNTDRSDEVEGVYNIGSFVQFFDTNTQLQSSLAAVDSSDYVAPSTVDIAATEGSTTVDIATSETLPAGEVEDIYNIDLSDYMTELNKEVEEMMRSSAKSMKYIGDAHRFFGAPYRFLKETDPQISFTDNDGKSFTDGRTYTKNIAMEAPLVHFIPGLPTYMQDISDANRDILSNYIKERQNNSEVSNEVLERISGIEGRYFDFVASYSEYIKYVNILCRTSAIYMGIGDKTVPGTNTKYKNYNYENWQDGGDDLGKGFFEKVTDWDTIVSNADGKNGIAGNVAAFYEQFYSTVGETAVSVAKEIVSGNKSVKLYVDSGSSFSESVSNSTTQSQIASIFDTSQNLMKEVQFWGGAKVSNTVTEVGADITSAIDNISTSVLSMLGLGESGLTNLANYANYIISGSNIVFPEMWTDGSYSKSYRFSVNLVSPYGDSESIFINIIVPLMFILGFSLPRQTSANSFASPMLVRVVSKGWFSCDMGIIDSISIEKGGDDEWNASGLPLSMKIDIGVKDLYSSLSIAKTTQPELFFNNPALLEFLAATCGVDTIQPNLKLKIMTFLNGISNIITDIPSNVYNSGIEALNNTIMRFTRLF